jgi:hypothetical protein
MLSQVPSIGPMGSIFEILVENRSVPVLSVLCGEQLPDSAPINLISIRAKVERTVRFEQLIFFEQKS